MRIPLLSAALLLSALGCANDSPVTTPPPAPFRLSTFEPSVTIAPNGTAEYVVNIFRDAGFATPLQTEVRNTPRGSAVTISPGVLEANDAFFVIRIFGSVPPGTYTVTATVKAATVPAVTLPLTLTVQ